MTEKPVFLLSLTNIFSKEFALPLGYSYINLLGIVPTHECMLTNCSLQHVHETEIRGTRGPSACWSTVCVKRTSKPTLNSVFNILKQKVTHSYEVN